MQKLILNWILSVAVFLHRATGGRVGGSMNRVPVLLLTAGDANLAKSARFHFLRKVKPPFHFLRGLNERFQRILDFLAYPLSV